MLDLNYIETVLKGKKGFEFQKHCVLYLRKKHGYDFQPVTPKGSLGDGGKDGYILKTGEYFAISSQVDNIASKIKSDFKSCMEQNHRVKIFTFVTNQELGPRECDALDDLKIKHPDMEVRVLDHTNIANELIDFPEREILKLLGKSVPILQDHKFFFKENHEKQMSFTLQQSLKDSMHLYAVLLISSIMIGGILFYFSAQWVQTVLVLVLLSGLWFYIKFKIDSLKKYKYAHKILYLLISNTFRVGDEVLLDEDRHTTIRRNSDWNFTINERSANCIKNGCSAKVYLYRSESNTFVGRCEKDKINHTYNVDNNFTVI